MATGDFNGDGRLDLVALNSGSNNLSVLLGNGDGSFQSAVNYGAGANPSSLALGDLNGDGKLDLAVANSGDNTVTTLLGNGDGTFQTAVPYGVGHSPSSVLVGDFGGDGRADLAVVNSADATLSVLLQAPVFSQSTPGLDFGNQNLGTTSNPQTVTVTNTGSATLYISNRAITGNNPGDFSETDNCGSSLPAGASCTAMSPSLRWRPGFAPRFCRYRQRLRQPTYRQPFGHGRSTGSRPFPQQPDFHPAATWYPQRR